MLELETAKELELGVADELELVIELEELEKLDDDDELI